MTGLVSLVGAGCAAGLLTVLGSERLAECDAVVYDDLIDQDILALASHAELIYMGKRSGKHSARQDEICAELIRLAREGKRVVRLKGGDPYIFGRGGEEMLALAEAGIPCEEIPGVSSAYAVPALAGIPLTHRGLSRGFTVVTAHTRDSDAELPEYFDSLAKAPGTIVILMGLGRLAQIAAHLVSHGMDAATPCAVVSAGSSKHDYCIRGTLADIAVRAESAEAPAVIVVGKCAALDLGSGGLPLSGKRIGLTGTPRMNAKLARELHALGAESFTACELEISPLPEADDLPVDCGCLVFTSSVGVELYFERLERSGRDVRALAGVKLAAVGKATAAALSRRALRADFIPAEQTTAALARLLLEELPEGGSVAIYRSDKGEKSFAEALSEKFSVRDIRAYTAAPGEYAASREELESADAFTFTSAAGARAALERCSPLPEGALLAALGNPTARALTGLDNRVAIAAEPSARSLAEAVADALSAEA